MYIVQRRNSYLIVLSKHPVCKQLVLMTLHCPLSDLSGPGMVVGFYLKQNYCLNACTTSN